MLWAAFFAEKLNLASDLFFDFSRFWLENSAWACGGFGTRGRGGGQNNLQENCSNFQLFFGCPKMGFYGAKGGEKVGAS